MAGSAANRGLAESLQHDQAQAFVQVLSEIDTRHDWSDCSGPANPFSTDVCAKCGATREQVEDGLRPDECPGLSATERHPVPRPKPPGLRDAEVDGSIADRIKEIQKQEGRELPPVKDEDAGPKTQPGDFI